MSLRNRWRPLSVGVAAVGLCLSILAVVLHQRRLSERLEHTIDAMQRTTQSVRAVETAPVREPQEAASSVPSEPRSRVVDSHAASRDELELEAATFVIANDYVAALESYRRLAERFPGERSFSDLVTILRAKVACRSDRADEGLSCD